MGRKLTRQWPAWRIGAFAAGLAGAALMPPAASQARPSAVAADGWEAARRATQYTYLPSGRIATSTVQGFDSGNQHVHTTVSAYTYDALGRVLSEDASTTSAAGAPLGKAIVTYEYDGFGELLTEDRLWQDAQGHSIRRESDVWRQDSDGARLRDTQVFGPDETLVETRYMIVARNARGQTLHTDESRYDSNGKQISRHLIELEHGLHGFTGRLLTHFDSADDVTSTVKEQWRYDAKGRLIEVHATWKDGSGQLTQTSQDSRTYDGRTGRLLTRDWTFHNAEGRLLRKLHELHNYDAAGRLLSRDGTWQTP